MPKNAMPEAKDIEALRVNLKKKRLLLENLTTQNQDIRNKIMSLEAEKKSYVVSFEESQASVNYKCKVEKELRDKLHNTSEQQLNTELASENICHTIEKYEQKILSLSLHTTVSFDKPLDNGLSENLEEMLIEIEVLQSQVYQNSVLIDKLWNMTNA